jgi:hypothetical protein
MNGEVFQGLNSLTWVVLIANECINEEFKELYRLKVLQEIVGRKCGFIESTTRITTDSDEELTDTTAELPTTAADHL